MRKIDQEMVAGRAETENSGMRNWKRAKSIPQKR